MQESTQYFQDALKKYDIYKKMKRSVIEEDDEDDESDEEEEDKEGGISYLEEAKFDSS